MTNMLIEKLAAATNEAEREDVILDLTLAGLSEELQTAVYAAAIPHWFNASLLDALLDHASDDLYLALTDLSFAEPVRGKGYAIREATRQQLLQRLWPEDQAQFRAWSQRVATYCQTQASRTEASLWQAEAIYHQLISQPDAGVAALQAIITEWANYKYYAYSEIERLIRLADEHIAAGRLAGMGAVWTRLWQAKLALLYQQPDLASQALAQLNDAPITDPFLAAEVAQTQGDIWQQQGDLPQAAAAWQTAYTLYEQLPNNQGQLDAYLVAEKRQHHSFPNPAPSAQPSESPTPRTDRTDNQLIENIYTAWIDGVLNQALNNSLDLRLTRAEGQPTNLVFHRPATLDRPVLGQGRLSRLFAAADQSLLILGAPGSGKTITLLQLLDELLQQARADRTVPIPLLFNLSSFGNFTRKEKGSFTDWLADQAYHQYRLKRQTLRERLVNGDFILLLDGLDEIAATGGTAVAIAADGLRNQCVTIINGFLKTASCGLVVCSRITDYQLLETELNLAHALVLQPLSNSQIDRYLVDLNHLQQARMQQRLVADWQLREALRSPLLLSLYPQAFAIFNNSHVNVNDAIEERRQQLFAAYVDANFALLSPEQTETLMGRFSRKSENSYTSRAKNLRWLIFLAIRMQQIGNSIFFIEDLQPFWVPKKFSGLYRGLYGLFLGLINGIIFELTELVFNLNKGLLFGFIDGLLFSGSGGSATWLTTRIKRSWLRSVLGGLIGGFIHILIIGSIIGISFWLRDGMFGGLLAIISIGLSGGLGAIISLSIASASSTIQLRERIKFLQPKWARIWHYTKQGALFGLSLGLVLGIVNGLSYESTTGLNVGIGVGLSMGLGIALLAFFDTPSVDGRPYAGDGVLTSLLNGLFMTLLFVFLIGIPALFLDQGLKQNGFLFYLTIINVLPPIFTWFGGLAWCQHWALRAVLWWQDWLPWQLVTWLEEMAARGLLRRVGGGYIFIHRSLLEYFANLETESF